MDHEKITSQGSSSGIPIGTVIIWPVATNPIGSDVWLECNGQSTSAYPALAAIVGATVPNYQGTFLRGYGSQPSTHYGMVLHSSGNLGELQGDSIRNITGTFLLNIPSGDGTNAGFTLNPTGAFYLNMTSARYVGGDIFLNNTGGAAFDASRVVPTANENRPINKAVRYLIKAQ